MPEKSLYFIAIIPPQPVYGEIKHYQKIMADEFNSHKSYSHIPHITLVPPFRIDIDKEMELKSILSSMDELPSITLEICGFSHFKKHTIFAEVKSNSILEKLHVNLLQLLNQSPNLLFKKINYFQKYRPHITIGYRDLEPNFEQAWHYFKSKQINITFDVHHFSLLKHNGEKWKICDL